MKSLTCTVIVLLVSLSSFCVWAQPINDEFTLLTDHDSAHEKIPVSFGDDDSSLPQLTRKARHRPFLAGAAVGAVVANHHEPTYYAPSYYYPPTYYPSSSGYYSNGYYYSG